MSTTTVDAASVNGVALHTPGEQLSADLLRQLACTELLRQEAVARGHLRDSGDPRDSSHSVSDAIEALLEHEVQVPEPTGEACGRFF
jgi:peptidyl-prolyl cis-trans isomerase C